MKDNGLMVYLREKVLKNFLIILFLMVCGKKVYQKVLAYVNIQMVVHMMVNGKKVNHMEWVRKFYLMAQRLTEDG